MYRYYFLIVAIMITVISENAYAQSSRRSMYIVPITLNTVAGGLLHSGNNIFTCMASNTKKFAPNVLDPTKTTQALADMVRFTNPNNGVTSISHIFSISVKNISDINQTVNFIIEKASMTAFNSEGTSNTGIQHVGADFTNPSTYEAKVTISGNESKVVDIRFTCNTDNCGVFFTDRTTMALTHLGGSNISPGCGGTRHACMKLTSELEVRLEIEEPRGAIIAHLQGTTKRGCGVSSRNLSSPISININGGRPF